MYRRSSAVAVSLAIFACVFSASARNEQQLCSGAEYLYCQDNYNKHDCAMQEPSSKCEVCAKVLECAQPSLNPCLDVGQIEQCTSLKNAIGCSSDDLSCAACTYYEEHCKLKQESICSDTMAQDLCSNVPSSAQCTLRYSYATCHFCAGFELTCGVVAGNIRRRCSDASEVNLCKSALNGPMCSTWNEVCDFCTILLAACNSKADDSSGNGDGRGSGSGSGDGSGSGSGSGSGDGSGSGSGSGDGSGSGSGSGDGSGSGSGSGSGDGNGSGSGSGDGSGSGSSDGSGSGSGSGDGSGSGSGSGDNSSTLDKSSTQDLCLEKVPQDLCSHSIVSDERCTSVLSADTCKFCGFFRTECGSLTGNILSHCDDNSEIALCVGTMQNKRCTNFGDSFCDYCKLLLEVCTTASQPTTVGSTAEFTPEAVSMSSVDITTAPKQKALDLTISHTVPVHVSNLTTEQAGNCASILFSGLTRAQFLAMEPSFHDGISAALQYQTVGSNDKKREVHGSSVIIVAPSPYKHPNGTMTVVIFVVNQDGIVLEGKALATAIAESKHYIAGKVGAKEIIQVYQGIPNNLLSETRESHNEIGMCSFSVFIYGILILLTIAVGAAFWCRKSRKPALLLHTDVKVYPKLYPVQQNQHDLTYVSKFKDNSL